MTVRSARWWLLGFAIVLTASGAEEARRHETSAAAVCIASVVLLRGSTCPLPSQTLAEPL